MELNTVLLIVTLKVRRSSSNYEHFLMTRSSLMIAVHFISQHVATAQSTGATEIPFPAAIS